VLARDQRVVGAAVHRDDRGGTDVLVGEPERRVSQEPLHVHSDVDVGGHQERARACAFAGGVAVVEPAAAQVPRQVELLRQRHEAKQEARRRRRLALGDHRRVDVPRQEQVGLGAPVGRELAGAAGVDVARLAARIAVPDHRGMRPGGHRQAEHADDDDADADDADDPLHGRFAKKCTEVEMFGFTVIPR
jgi:hypothetical protein